ncbi:hypothetical protein [Chachezhania sediminis]|uniref:hypothetical protein n=1 Tax=Chachezhania sediminis TaxID=2599291 RepID=UPI00131E919C|nr:hypothetical protein [Chachezhania sediminis]
MEDVVRSGERLQRRSAGILLAAGVVLAGLAGCDTGTGRTMVGPVEAAMLFSTVCVDPWPDAAAARAALDTLPVGAGDDAGIRNHRALKAAFAVTDPDTGKASCSMVFVSPTPPDAGAAGLATTFAAAVKPLVQGGQPKVMVGPGGVVVTASLKRGSHFVLRSAGPAAGGGFTYSARTGDWP